MGVINGLKNIFELIGFNISYNLDYPFVKPKILQITLTNRCNLQCKMCSVSKYTTRCDEEMELEEIEKIIRIAKKDFDISQLVLTGGEPLLVIDKVIGSAKLAKELGIGTLLTTNGYFLNEYASELVNSGITHFHISLDGLKETHNRLRNHPLSFDKAVEGIKKLASLREKNNSYSLGIGTLILKPNLNELYDLFKYGDSLKVDVFDLLAYLPDNTDFAIIKNDSFWLEDEDVLRFEDIYKKTIASGSEHINFNSNFQINLIKKYYQRSLGSKDWRCFAGFKNLFITLSDPKRLGRFEPCLFMCKTHIPIREYDYDLKKIWFSKQAAQARRAIKRCDSYCFQMCFALPTIMFLLKKKIDAFLKKYKNIWF
jgi:MoaA/NifB/PqqE/SkfB family radical SAM enzyme